MATGQKYGVLYYDEAPDTSPRAGKGLAGRKSFPILFPRSDVVNGSFATPPPSPRMSCDAIKVQLAKGVSQIKKTFDSEMNPSSEDPQIQVENKLTSSTNDFSTNVTSLLKP